MGVELLQGDCLDILPTLPSASVDMVLADLPYGITKCKWDFPIPLEPLWTEYSRVLKPNGAVLLTAVQPFTSVLVLSNPEWFRYEWVWEKTTATGYLNAKKMPMRAHENVLVFYQALPTYNPQKTTGHERKVSAKNSRGPSDCYGKHDVPTTYDSTERYPRSVVLTSTDKQKSKLHPTQKPVALMEYFVRTYTNPGDTVLDNVMGSGTTGVACVNTGRNFVGIERDTEYFKTAEERILGMLEQARSARSASTTKP